MKMLKSIGLTAILAVACMELLSGCKHGNINQGDLPLVPIWQHTNP